MKFVAATSQVLDNVWIPAGLIDKTRQFVANSENGGNATDQRLHISTPIPFCFRGHQLVLHPMGLAQCPLLWHVQTPAPTSG
jgi:hypothetical protein